MKTYKVETIKKIKETWEVKVPNSFDNENEYPEPRKYKSKLIGEEEIAYYGVSHCEPMVAVKEPK